MFGVSVQIKTKNTLLTCLDRYDVALIANGTAADISAAEARIMAACRAAKIWFIVGLPKYMDAGVIPTEATCDANATWWNTALVINDQGEKVYRQAKLRCGGPDGQLGRWQDTFSGVISIEIAAFSIENSTKNAAISTEIHSKSTTPSPFQLDFHVLCC